ncbi:MAG: glycosyltransferase [Desulfococcaceae bacterium]
MGAVHFSIDTDLVRFFRDRLAIPVFVETGTYRGDSLERARPFFDRLLSVESSARFFREASARFASDSAIKIHQGDSAEFLEDRSETLRETPALFWLDAHWCVDEGTAGESSQCPLLRELAAIGRLHPQSVVMIDDFRFFLSPPNAPHDISQWPSLDVVLAALESLSDVHRLMVVNDVGVLYPMDLRDDLREYARLNGVDWLGVAHRSREYEEILRQAREKDEALLEKDRALREKLTEVARLRETADRNRRELAEVGERRRAEQASLAAEINRLSAILEERADALERVSGAIGEIRAVHEAEMKRAEVRFADQSRRLAELAAKNSELSGIVVQQAEAIRHFESARADRRFKEWGRRRKEAIRRRILHHRRRARDFFRPRLGSLQQHPPRPLAIPARYHRIPRRGDWPRISLVTPSFRQANFIERTLRSVLDQNYPALEYVVQDGGSADGTADILRQYDAVLHRWVSERDGGQTEAINRGFRGTSGEIMAWLNSDDLLLPGSLHYVADHFRRHPEVDAIYGHRVLIDEADREIGRWVLPPHDEKVLTWADFVPQETLFWRRRLWERVGGRVDEDFQFAMDWDLLLRFQEAGARIVRVPRFLGAFRVHTRQKTSADLAETGWREMARLRRRCHGRPVADAEIFPNIRNYLAIHMVLTKLFRAGILRY